MRTLALFDEKNIGFFEIYGVCVRTDKVGVEPVRIFCGQRERAVDFFRDFVRMSFMYGPLSVLMV